MTKMLRLDHVADYQAWLENRKRPRDLVHQLEELSLSVIEDDPRTPAAGDGRGPSST